jgi:hypothetical protein
MMAFTHGLGPLPGHPLQGSGRVSFMCPDICHPCSQLVPDERSGT